MIRTDIFKETIPVFIQGLPNTGKSSIINILKNGTSDITGDNRPSRALINTRVKINDAKLDMWKIGSLSNDDNHLNRNLMSKCEALVLVYDSTNQSSFAVLQQYINECKDLRKINLPLICILGTKSDLESEREVLREDLDNLRRKNNIDIFHEISITQPERIKVIFEGISKSIVERIESDKKNIKLNPSYVLTTVQRCW